MLSRLLCFLILVTTTVVVSANRCVKGVCVEERFCANVTGAAAVEHGGYRGCITRHKTYGVCCSEVRKLCRRKGGDSWYECNPVKPTTSRPKRQADTNAFPACRTPDRHPGRCVPLKMCDHLNDPHSKKLHKWSPVFAKFLLKSKCGASDTSVCCRNPTDPDQIVKSRHAMAQKLGLDRCGSIPLTDRVLQGEEAGLGQYPWMANIMYYVDKVKTSLCSGSLIHPMYVLTAAHCKKSKIEPVSVRFGEHDFRTKVDCVGGICAAPYKESYIAEWIRHEHYRPPNSGVAVNDIALIRLYTAVSLIPGQIFPICLPLTERMMLTKPQRLTVSGWGMTGNPTQSEVLREAALEVIEDAAECAKEEGVICARGRNYEGHCKGDSGGPLQAVMPYGSSSRTVLYGVVSRGPSDCSVRDTTPGVSTSVSYHLKWILKHMKYL